MLCFAYGRRYIVVGGFLKIYCRTVRSSRVLPVVAYSITIPRDTRLPYTRAHSFDFKRLHTTNSTGWPFYEKRNNRLEK